MREINLGRGRDYAVAPDNQLMSLLAELVKRFGTGRTLGEVYANSYAIAASREGRTVSIAEISDATGVSKQNLSRWLQRQIEVDHVTVQPNENDARVQEINIPDLDLAGRHLESIADILDCKMDPPTSWRNGWRTLGTPLT